MKISNIMSRDVQIIGPNQTLREAASVMEKLDAGALPVGAQTPRPHDRE